MNYNISKIDSSFEGFSKLADLNFNLQNSTSEYICLNFSGCPWFDANMSSPLGAILDLHAAKGKSFTFNNIPIGIQTILQKNRFLCDYGLLPKADTNITTIPYHKFFTSNALDFVEYLRQHIRGKGIPQMSSALKISFQNSLLEVFENSASHSETKHAIKTCGQYYPNKNRLDFCIADSGIGIRRKIFNELQLAMNSDIAIEWALQEGNTTKKGAIPGGLGLNLLRSFIRLNNGRIQIVSDRGYWELRNGKESSRRIDRTFPGTAVNIEINTADTNSYHLSNEIH